jgi:methylamine---glutamate N-methyltransferase subunit B
VTVVAGALDTGEVLRVTAGDRPLREVNREIRHAVAEGRTVHVDETMSRHNLGVGLTGAGTVVFDGSVGYYCGGLLAGAHVVIGRNTGWSVAESMSAGSTTVHGNAGMSAGASIRGGLLHIKGNAGPRTGVAMKGGDIVVEGNVGYACAFMAHAGRLIVLGDTATSTGDSLWQGCVWVAGSIGALGIDTKVVEPPADEVASVEALLASIGAADTRRDWKKVVSAEQLWHFKSRDAKSWLMI